MTRKGIWTIILASFTSVVVIAGLMFGSYLYWAIVLEPGEEVQVDNIRRILGKESPVFYSDGQTRLGVFFDQAHRQYVTYDEIPKNFVNALVASEDNLFFSHFGFDPIGIGRAAIKNIQAGKVVQGGSTLTQQTAKNLFKRSERSYQAKLKELLYALRLEYHYSKEQIFEFYANQFYVAGNSHGLGVAARYYFDKKPVDLSLLECAFIAGSVKRPNYYNPFTKKSEQAVKLARDRGRTRMDYVLEKMFDLKMIDKQTYDTALATEIQFKKGKVGYELDYVMEMVRDAVSTSVVQEALKEHGINNVATSGIRVISSVDHILQEKTLYALRRQLSRLDVRLRGYEREEVQEELAQTDYAGDRSVKERAFLFGSVLAVSSDADTLGIEVDLGPKRGAGFVDKEGLSRLVKARTKWQRNPWAKEKQKDYLSLLEQFQEGDKLWVSVRRIDEDGQIDLDLERFPQVQGGALVVHEGVIKAMAGGTENRFFNRAISARRTLGSSYKPFVYTAALQLGWSPSDLLKNKRDVFVFQNQPYFPRPDHKSPYEYVSMSWAGVHSENVASVWLVYHLCDHLDSEQLYDVASHLDMAPRIVNGEEEPYRNFKARLRDKYGILVNRDSLGHAAYNLAVTNLETDFIFANREKEYRKLQELHYGLGFSGFLQKINGRLAENNEEKKLSNNEEKELVWRAGILDDNFLALQKLFEEMERYINRLSAPLERPSFFYDPPDPDPAGLYYDQKAELYIFCRRSQARPDMIHVADEKVKRFMRDQNKDDQNRFWTNVSLNSTLSVASFHLVSDQIHIELKRLKEKLPYSLDVLSAVPDYRIMVGLQYLIRFAQQAGITSRLEPVLSFPLGSNVTTLLESVRMYEGLVTGNVVVSKAESRDEQDLLAVIDRIESASGEELFRPERLPRKLVAPEVSVEIGHVLENTIKFGTGRYADKHVRISYSAKSDEQVSPEMELKVPMLGKTGTANRYTNAAFLGYLPGVSEEQDAMSIHGGYAVGVYVGFDDNKTMRKGATKVTGSLGALPAWTEIVNALLVENNYSEKLDPVDLSFTGLMLKRPGLDQLNLAAEPGRGGKVKAPAQDVDEIDRTSPSILSFGTLDGSGQFVADRRIQPFWLQFSEANETVEVPE